MNQNVNETLAAKLSRRAGELFHDQQQSIICHTDRLFAWLMGSQWLFAVILVFWVSPLTWNGENSKVHPHVWAALALGAIITAFPVAMALLQPGKTMTRHVIAVGQMLMSALLIHLTGGRIETHFHVFGSLAILAFYRDWRVMVSASAIVYVDHLARGMFWPQSVYGVMSAPIWRSLEHAGWVVFEVTFLLISIGKSLAEMRLVAERQAKIEFSKEEIEQTVAERTAELTREITERRQAEEQVRKGEGQLAHAQRIARLGSWEWDLAKNEVTWSDEGKRLYGHSPAEPISSMELCLSRVEPEDLAQFNRSMSESLRTGEPFICDHRVRLPDGAEKVLQCRAQTQLNGGGKAVRAFGTVQDITDAKRAEQALIRSEEQLRQSQKMEAIGRLAGGVAHDFNNLLTVIGGYCALSLTKAGGNTALETNLAQIQKASERASALTSQLLAFSRKQVLQPQIINLQDVVSGMEKMLRRLIGEDIDLSIACDRIVGNVKADRGQIEQVIMNLVVNARDAMPRGGKLTISAGNVALDQKMSARNRTLEVGDYVMLSVTDTGMGMSEDVKAHLFEPFFTTKGVGKGTGLGLATCYGIISQSNGDIRVYSEPNTGTVFKIYLPRTDATPQQTGDTDLTRLPTGKESILVVEDDSAVRMLALIILREAGYTVHECNNAFEALALIRKSAPFDLVLSDVIMPQMSGKQLHDEIKSQLPHTKVLLMSGYTDDALAHHGVLDEGLCFIEKPFSPAQLTRKVRDVLDAPVPTPANRGAVAWPA